MRFDREILVPPRLDVERGYGKRFAFVRRDVENRETFLFIANADGSGQQQLAARKRPDYFLISGPALVISGGLP
jgi:hypothetical protein